MGTLAYGNSGLAIEFDDRTLIHLQLVMGPKLRRRESFFFSWRHDAAVGPGRTSIWIDACIPMVFRYSADRRYDINRAWLEVLVGSAGSAQGLQLVAEPEPIPSIAAS